MKLFQFVFKVLALSSIFVFMVQAASEGVEYEKLKTPLADEQNTFIEAFSFSCIHCYTHHKQNTLARVKGQVPNLEYKIYPVKAGYYGEEFAQLYAYALFKDKALKLDSTMQQSLTHKLADVYFVAFFERKIRWDSSEQFYNLGLKTLGIDKNELEKFLTSKEGKASYANLDKAYSIASQTGGTPSFAINGKFLIKMQNIKSLEQFIQVSKEISQK